MILDHEHPPRRLFQRFPLLLLRFSFLQHSQSLPSFLPRQLMHLERRGYYLMRLRNSETREEDHLWLSLLANPNSSSPTSLFSPICMEKSLISSCSAFSMLSLSSASFTTFGTEELGTEDRKGAEILVGAPILLGA